MKKNRNIKTKDKFILEANKTHKNTYSYNRVTFVNLTTKVEIICPIHGSFFQQPNKHLMGSICPKCAYIRSSNKHRTTISNFIKRANITHNSKYNYSKVTFNRITDKVTIICPSHGQFPQSAISHINGRSCPKCAMIARRKKQTLPLEQFVSISNGIHNNKYDYSKVEYKNTTTKVCIVCPDHGKFKQLPSLHMKGSGCPKCSNISIGKTLAMSLGEFIDRGNTKYNNKFDYSNVIYVNAKVKVKIICPIHGLFEQIPYTHLNSPNGCPQCRESKLEKEVSTLLKQLNLDHIREHKFKEVEHISNMRYDFFIPSINLIIECHGSHHFKRNHFFHRSEKEYKQRVEYDKIKEEYCKKNNINFIIYTRKRFTNRTDVITNIDELMKIITTFVVK